MSNPIIEIHQLTRRYGDKLALDAVDLVAEEKGVVGIVGENGAGKTTLMNILYGLYHADEGDIVVDGEVKQFESLRSVIAVTDDPGLKTRIGSSFLHRFEKTGLVILKTVALCVGAFQRG